MKVALDTSYLIAFLSEWHKFHQDTYATHEELRRRREQLIVAGHAFFECFSAVTRMPPPNRVLPEQAHQALWENFSKDVEIAGTTPALVWSVLEELSRRGLGGGLTYDAAIARTVREAGATVLFTWNAKHFLVVAPPGLEIREPRLPFPTS